MGDMMTFPSSVEDFMEQYKMITLLCVKQKIRNRRKHIKGASMCVFLLSFISRRSSICSYDWMDC